MHKEVKMTWWICSECDYVFQAEAPPDACPSCHVKCVYSDVTCYIPQCGGPGHLDAKLVALKADEARRQMKLRDARRQSR